MPYKSPPYVIDPETDCWNWIRYINEDGYGVKSFGFDSEGKRIQNRQAHCWMYEQKYGPIPEGTELDHLCRNRRCVNPDHLEPVPHIENCHRGSCTTLRPDDWRTIKILYRHTNMSQDLIGAIFGVQQALISKIVLERPGYQSKSDT